MTRKKIVKVNVPPEGLFYVPSFLSAAEELELLEKISAEEFKPYDYQGFIAKREIVFYGTNGGYKGRDDQSTPAMPAWLQPLRERCANLIGLESDELAMALVAHYPVGAGIGWHRDAPQFGPTIVGVSFASGAAMRFRRFVNAKEEMFHVKLERRSGYIISGPARTEWQHGMSPVKELRYSITFRTLRARPRASDNRHAPESIAERLRELNLIVPDELAEECAQLSLFQG